MATRGDHKSRSHADFEMRALRWFIACRTSGRERLFDAHTRSFGAFGGIPQRGIYRNMKTAVDRVRCGAGNPGIPWRIRNAQR